MSDDLVAFLDARLDEDEANAPNMHQSEISLSRNACDSLNGFPCDCGVPERISREVAAKRAILAEHERSCCVKAMCCGEIEEWFDADSGDPCPTLRLLAAVYSGHLDYREAWAITPTPTPKPR